jgi:hypothetical protein
MKCPACQKEISGDASVCSSCGFSFDDATQRLESNAPPAGKSQQKESRSSMSFDSIDDARFIPGTIVAERYRIVGLLAAVAAFFFAHLWVFFPMTTELTAWYATDFTIALVICVALAGYGFYTSLAGQPLFGGKLLQD